MTKKQKQEVVRLFYEAAEFIELSRFHGCCVALDHVTNNRYNGSAMLDYYLIMKQVFNRMFRQDAFNLGHSPSFWFEEVGEGEHPKNYEKLKNRRVMGLLLCAHLIETDSLPFKLD